MGLRINTNMASISAQRVLSVQQKRADHAAAALSSGSRIVNAADDAAGLSISESLKGQIRGIGQARSNAFNAGSAIQISEGGLNEINNVLIRLRELGIQAASDNVEKLKEPFSIKKLSKLFRNQIELPVQPDSERKTFSMAPEEKWSSMWEHSEAKKIEFLIIYLPMRPPKPSG